MSVVLSAREWESSRVGGAACPREASSSSVYIFPNGKQAITVNEIHKHKIDNEHEHEHGRSVSITQKGKQADSSIRSRFEKKITSFMVVHYKRNVREK